MTPRHPFDPLAAHYWWLEAVTFGPLLHWCRTAHLPLAAGRRRALVVGDGDGRFLHALLRAHPGLVVDSLDVSPAMIARARRQVRGQSGATLVRFVAADIRTAPLPPASYDLIVTHFLLDCFPADELAGVVARLATAATPDARWLVGDFALPPGRWRPRAARVALAVMYAFFRRVTGLTAAELVDPAPLLAARRFTPTADAVRLGGFLRSRVWDRAG